jgi:ribosomal-protein-alanine N-acetyltransferase
MSDRGDEFFDHFTVRYDAVLAEEARRHCASYVLVAGDVSVPGEFKLVDTEDHAAELGYGSRSSRPWRGDASVRELLLAASGPARPRPADRPGGPVTGS